MRMDTVLDMDANRIFNGTTEETVAWLEANPSVEPRWVCIGETGDLLTSSQYLDLAS